MKQLLCICFLFLCASINAHAQDAEPLEFSEVVQATGVSKDELYNRARNWVVQTYNSANDVIQLADKESGQITVKALILSKFKIFNMKTAYTMSIYIKDGRYKYIFSDFILTATSPQHTKPAEFGLLTTAIDAPKMGPYYWRSHVQKIWDIAKLEVQNLRETQIISLKSAMSTETETQSDDW